MNPPRFPNIPSVNELLEAAPLKGLKAKMSRNVVVTGVRSFLDNLRRDLGAAAKEMGMPSPSELAEKIAGWIVSADQPPLRPVINATGALLHAGLGRAPLADEAIHELAAVAGGYSNLEFDLETGARTNRLTAVERLLRQLTGAEAALVVNNNTAATLLVLAGLANGREVIVSRGQLVEIGESFRLPDVVQTSGALLREVGTTNKTRAGDYESAVSDRTAAMLRVHLSNFKVVGFAEEATTAELAAVAQRHNVPLIVDLGSGALIDLEAYGLAGEPVVSESIRQGADVVLTSGDKLLGGPQCGVIVGRRDLLQKIAQHPLYRAFRVDKLTLAALAATLRLYLTTDTAESRVPLLALLATPTENLKHRAERLAEQMQSQAGISAAVAVPSQAPLWGSASPNPELETYCVALSPASGNVERLSAALRTGNPAVVGREDGDRLLLDLKTVPPKQDADLLSAVAKLATVKTSASDPA